MLVKVSADLMPPREIIEKLGVGDKGKVQQFLTERMKFRMNPYMPYLSGSMADATTHVTSPTTITVTAPYARYVYEGVSKSGKPLKYTRTEDKHPKATSYWDRVLVQNEGAAIAKEVEGYARRLNERA